MKAIDLFCGAGGFSNGFEQAGIEVLYGVDINERALETFERTHDGQALCHNISQAVPDEILALKDEVDIVFGSPPCQGFSDARGSRSLDDERNQLVFSFIQWVGALEPSFVLMENVAGMMTIGDDFLQAIQTEYSNVGYTITWEKLNAADYGVPQARERVIYFGVPEDSPIDPSLPTGEYVKDGDGQLTLTGERKKGWTTVSDALADLPAPTADGCISLPDLTTYPDNDYLPLVRDGATETWNHTAKLPRDDPDTQAIVNSLKPGEMYRSSRFGDRYRQVWDLLADQFTERERDCLHFIARHRTRKDYFLGEKTVGAVPVATIAANLDADEADIEAALSALLADGWVRTKEVEGVIGYDLNTKSGIRPRFMRLEPDGQANTILTTDFNPRDKLHPTENRGLSLREGARIQSFPDSFEFLGSFDEIATQIGNAVPPLMAKRLAKHVLEVSS